MDYVAKQAALQAEFQELANRINQFEAQRQQVDSALAQVRAAAIKVQGKLELLQEMIDENADLRPMRRESIPIQPRNP